MAGIQLSGLSSGLDTEGLIAGLMSVERAPRTKITLRQAAVHARQDGLQAVEAKLKALKLASDDLGSFLTWNPVQTATSNDTTKGTARILAGAAPGTYNVNVTQLATAEQRTYTYTPKASAQTYTLNGKSFTINANEALDSLVSRLNTDSSYNVYAVNSGGNLVLTSRTTGTAGAITMSGGGGNVLQEQTALARAAKNATYTIDGASYSSSSNTISSSSGATGFVTGVEMTLVGTGAFAVTVSPPQVDKAAVTSKVKAFVDAYNAAVDLMQAKVTEKRVPNAATESDARKGALWADSTVTGVMQSLRTTISTFMQSGNASTMDELAEIGISTGAPVGTGTFSQDSVNGKLVLDTTKLSAALDSDSTAVQRMLGGLSGTNGFSQTFGNALTPYTQTAGIFDSSVDSTNREIAMLNDSLKRMDDRLAMKEDRLRKMFTNLETALNKTKSQGAELLAKLGVSNDS
jgi:flagellar hook-associated protein 2